MNMTAIHGCTCRHEWQDKKYGEGRRVMNRKQKDVKAGLWVCTVCEKQHSFIDKEAEVLRSKDGVEDKKKK